MLKLKEAVIVEGKYDKSKVMSVVDCLVVQTNGFGIFKDNKKLNLIRELAKTRGIIVFTDSDASGFMIRNYIKTCVQEGTVKHAYIPEIDGKEKRKDKPSKAGKLGVEGMAAQVIIDCLLKSNADIEEKRDARKITKQDFYDFGFTGRENSKTKRSKLINKLNLPSCMSSNDLLRFLNSVWSYNEFIENIKSFDLEK